jgi:repressor LexA
MSKELTERQAQVYQFMTDHLTETHSLPTMVEIASQFGMSVNAAQCHKKLMVKKGWLVEVPKGRYRLGHASVSVETHCTV